jgi:uncharacterized membrane-anchored protein
VNRYFLTISYKIKERAIDTELPRNGWQRSIQQREERATNTTLFHDDKRSRLNAARKEQPALPPPSSLSSSTFAQP